MFFSKKLVLVKKNEIDVREFCGKKWGFVNSPIVKKSPKLFLLVARQPFLIKVGNSRIESENTSRNAIRR